MYTDQNQLRTSIFRLEHFNAAHRLDNPRWDERKNKEVFGNCNNPNYHGHNYELEVRITGPIDPTTENIAFVIYGLLRRRILSKYDL